MQHILVSPNNEEYEMLLDDLKDRVMEHQGETIYVVGTGGTILIQYRDVLEVGGSSGPNKINLSSPDKEKEMQNS